jgi:hypothetical protein
MNKLHFTFLGAIFISGLAHADLTSTIMADSPLGYWRLNEAAGSTVAQDYSGFGHHGAVSGNVTFGASGGTGATSALFNGGDISIQATSPSSFKGANGLTVTLWFNSPGVVVNPGQDPRGIYDMLDYRIDTAAGKYTCRLQADSIHGILSSQPHMQVGVAGDFANGKWHQYAFTANTATGLALYIDGQQVATNNQPFTWSMAQDTLKIGGMPGYGAYQYFGSMSDVAVFGTALSPDRILAQYRAATVPEPASMAALGLGVLALIKKRKSKSA